MNIQNLSGVEPENMHGTRPPKPLSGWLVEPAMLLDEANPGFLRQTCRATRIWRHCFAAVLAAGLMNHPALFLSRLHGRPSSSERTAADLLGEVAEILPILPPREIILAGIGSCPEGYIAALKKFGEKPLSREVYGRLLDMHGGSEPMQRRRRRVLEQLTAVDEAQFEALERLDPVLVMPVVLEKINSAASADSLNQALSVIRACCSTATDDALRQSLTAFVAGGPRRWIKKWLEKADFGVSALAIEDPEFEVVSPSNAGRISERFRNCLKSMTPRMLTRNWAAAVYEPASVVVTFIRLHDGGWLMTGVYGIGNGPVAQEQVRQVREKILSLGLSFAVIAETPPELLAVAQMADPFAFIHDLDDIQ